MVRLGDAAFITSYFSVVFLGYGLTILAVGNIFRADFGLFYRPHNAGALYSRITLMFYMHNGLTKSGTSG